MKIMLVITGLTVGGAEKVVISLAESLFNKKHEVIIISLTNKIILRPNTNDIKVVSLGMKSSLDFLKAYIKLYKIISEFKPDVIHSHMIHANILCRLVRIAKNFPLLITTSHNNYEGNKTRLFIYKITNRLSNISTNVSNNAVQKFIKNNHVKPEQMICIPNGIDINKFKFCNTQRYKIRESLNITNEKKMILAIGRLDKAKDYPNLINSIYLLAEKRNDFQLFIAGDGPLKKELFNLVNKLKLTKFICFLGIRDDIPNLLCACDLFVLSSEWEGLPLVIGEAMACERIIVSTDCGGTKEILGNIYDTVPVKNDIKLFNKINESLDFSDEKKQYLGKRARKQIIDNYSLERTTEHYLNIYNKD